MGLKSLASARASASISSPLPSEEASPASSAGSGGADDSKLAVLAARLAGGPAGGGMADPGAFAMTGGTVTSVITGVAAGIGPTLGWLWLGRLAS